MLGPVFRLEAIRTARRGRFYVTRVVFGLALLLFLLSEVENWNWYPQYFPTARPSVVVAAAFSRFCWLQLLFLAFVIPAVLAGVLGRELDRRTLADLLALPLSSAEILLGLVGSRLASVLMALLVGLPVVALMGLVGGLDFYVVAVVYAMTAALLLFLGGLSALVATVTLRSRVAASLAFLLVFGWLASPLPLFNYLGRGRLSPPVQSAVETYVLRHPVGLLMLFTTHETQRMFNPAMRMRGWKIGPWSLPSHAMASVVIHAGLGLALFGLAVLVLMARRRGWFARGRRPPRFAPDRPAVSDDPMLWKERYASGGGIATPRAARALAAILVSGLIVYLYDSARRSLGFGVGLEFFVDAVRASFVTLNVLALFTVAAAAALSIVGERERETWNSLRTTLVTGRDIVRAKQFGAVWALRWIGAGVLLLWGAGLVTRTLTPLGVLATGLGLIVFIWYAAALGVAISAWALDSTRALGLTALFLILTNCGYLLPLMAALNLTQSGFDTNPAWLLVGMTPYLQWAALTTPQEQSTLIWGQGSAVLNLGSLIVYRGSQVLPALAVSLVLHAAAAWGLTRWTSRTLDATPRRERPRVTELAAPKPAAHALAGPS